MTGLLRRQTIERYTGMVAMREPEPGGGSAAACVLSLAAACLAKTAAYTIGTERCRSAWLRARAVRALAENVRMRALRLIDADARAYRRVAQARRMRRQTVEQERRRKRALLDAERLADAVLCDIVDAASQVTEAVAGLAGRSNRLLDGDLRCALLCAAAAAAAAVGLLSGHCGAPGIRARRKERRIRAVTPPVAARLERVA